MTLNPITQNKPRVDFRGDPVVLRIHLPMRGTWVRILVQEDLLEEGLATHFSILVWRIP